MRLFPAARKLIADAFKRGLNIKVLADVFGICRQTASKWARGKGRIGKTRFLDRQRKAKRSKITLEIELAILAMRTLFRWGTARIQQGLIDLPDFAKEALQNTVENIKLSRTAINNVLKKHKLNGYLNEGKTWKFFRAKVPNELWQIDLKGPFVLQGRKYFFAICIDDYSRYILLAEQFDHCPSTKEICQALEGLGIFPQSILADNGGQFRREWERWCRCNGINPIFAHPYYPQDKGKVERCIRNVAEEFINLIVKFPKWINGAIKEYVKWYNQKRFHRGINNYPGRLYVNLET